jgi:deazaflavin-dependent oxidoreductase (nitroreductase family)
MAEAMAEAMGEHVHPPSTARRWRRVWWRRALQGGLTALHLACYRATGGAIGHRLGPLPHLLLTTTGRRSGRPRTTVLTYLRTAGLLALVASNFGSRTAPQWFRNLEAHPAARVQLKRSRWVVHTRLATAEERAHLGGGAGDLAGVGELCHARPAADPDGGAGAGRARRSSPRKVSARALSRRWGASRPLRPHGGPERIPHGEEETAMVYEWWHTPALRRNMESYTVCQHLTELHRRAESIALVPQAHQELGDLWLVSKRRDEYVMQEWARWRDVIRPQGAGVLFLDGADRPMSRPRRREGARIGVGHTA